MSFKNLKAENVKMTNSNLIAIFNGQIAHQSVQLCNARELHSFLESQRQYANWISERIKDYGFTENEDYIIVTERTNGRPRKEYHITLDMGKELAMVERNEKGRQIRKYFIECERQAKQKNEENRPLAIPEKTYTFTLTEYELRKLAWLWKIAERMRNILYALNDPLEKLGSRYSACVYGASREYKLSLDECQKLLTRMTADVECHPNDSRNHWQRVLPELRKGKLNNPI
ncbi:hypothetical protein A4G19_15750 [Pasteurellaceae bacterium Macca]|nr:hypothetical protein [Pasteurellaceae bacterium Macca]MCK3656017.1 hypothetical protein [Pasteurellaceae bacterium Macca]MCK3656181.1 hypothetical protein [Pasteurellaceae bacterium Macca]MCK3656650.1 hypothetical protein [Pasteurellaceae bacterium Macca]MCK3657111.1 hypothetical protein [Pasteurellaceae bacterium Macca]